MPELPEYLLDTHALLWFDTDPTKLSSDALQLMQDPSNSILVSSMTAWELGIKFSLGKLSGARGLVSNYHRTLAKYGFLEVAFTSHDALRAASLPATHKDPFDRALVAQALERNIPILSVDGVLDSLGVTRIW
jgi:PIN domain nuclease of toxin-antitoxin system